MSKLKDRLALTLTSIATAIRLVREVLLNLIQIVAVVLAMYLLVVGMQQGPVEVLKHLEALLAQITAG